MFGRRKRIKANHADCLIGQHTEIHGDLKFSDGLVILGAVYGDVIANDGGTCVLNVSESGRVEGEIRVPNVVINGVVSGDVYAAEQVQLNANARINGNVYYRLIEMEIGAEVNGSLVHLGDGSDARLKLHHEPPLGGAVVAIDDMTNAAEVSDQVVAALPADSTDTRSKREQTDE